MPADPTAVRRLGARIREHLPTPDTSVPIAIAGRPQIAQDSPTWRRVLETTGQADSLDFDPPPLATSTT